MPRTIQWVILLISLIALTGIINLSIHATSTPSGMADTLARPDWPWEAPDTATIPRTPNGDLVRYGRNLIVHTARYLGPQGIVRAISNGMNCQNCHLDAGTRPWGNNYSAVATTYPRFRDRSGTIETVEKRVNDCLQRSLHGQPLDSNSRELKAMVAYLMWVGSNVPAKRKPVGAGISSLPYPNLPADPVAGKGVYSRYCQRCHGKDGQGLRDSTGPGYLYPPVWGPHSFNTAAGIYRLSKLAGYVRDNMPYEEAYHHKPVLTDEEAWHVAAYINAQPRPEKTFPGDWPRISTKPVDHPFGPFSDTFSARQHKYGPFQPIVDYREKNKPAP
ncbi:c-type cytochrome [Paraflavitalea pollutisoli]|uniref:c-type cytochrome n=1 Tax=Paraflavitalea pollutisoli TaxID=3034143 RepID=UPI0023EB59E8|nr:c-type cytochrome [Paraflavitalea sp. H1-2-19X]